MTDKRTDETRAARDRAFDRLMAVVDELPAHFRPIVRCAAREYGDARVDYVLASFVEPCADPCDEPADELDTCNRAIERLDADEPTTDAS